MFIMECLGMSSEGHLSIGGMSVVALAKKYGTPLYIMDESQIRKNCRMYKKALSGYSGEFMVAYASKAFACKEMYRIIAEEGFGADVVSGGELHTALESGFSPEKIIFHGNNKTKVELCMALENSVGRIAVDNLEELKVLSELSVKLNKTVNILLRIKPGVEAHTHEFIKTGQIDSKFGFALETGEAEEAVELAMSAPNISLNGVHCHIGSQIFDSEPFHLSAEILIKFIISMKNTYNANMTELNLGGGYGTAYLLKDDAPSIFTAITSLSSSINELMATHNIKLKLFLEPGRSIVADAGLTVYTVGSVKNIPNIRTYVSVDGGMTDNPRHILYGAEYDAVLPERPIADCKNKVTIAGRCCESGDVLIKDIDMPAIKSGDLLAILVTGAYNYSMAGNYNRVPRPPVIMVNNGIDRVVIKRESYEDLIRNDI